MSTIIKRDGSVENFDVAKLLTVLQKANSENTATAEQLKDVVRKIAENVPETTAELRSLVETSLVEAGLSKVASSYIIECYKAEARRVKGYVDQSILSLIDNSNSEVMEENGNKNPVLVSTQRDLIAGETSKDIARRFIFSKESIEAHDKGAIHIHDMDYAIQNLINCHLVNLEDMLQNGTMINGVKIDRPKSLRTAVTLASQISAQVSSSTYGGQTMYLSNLSPFVDVSRQKIRAEVESELADLGVSAEKIDEIVAKRLKDEIKDSVQTFTYQINTISGTNGQSPFITVFIYLGDVKDEQGKQDLALLAEEMFKQRIKGFKNALGKWVAPTFPKLIYVLEEDNIHTDSEFYWLTELAAKCISKRMVPDLISEKVMKRLKNGDVYGIMGCRSALTPDLINHKYLGRFNLGVVSLNLPYIAYESGGNIEKFFELLEDYGERAFDAHMARVDNLRKATSDVAPILWQHGSIARLKPGEKIEKLFYNNYSTISLGYMGLYETVKFLTGFSHTDPAAKDFAISVLVKLEEMCDRWKEETGLGFSLYGTPAESLTDKFASAVKRDFDPNFRDWVTNSFHVDVEEEISAFDKLAFEAQFQEHSKGGMISYIETADLSKNIEAILALMKYMYDTIMYAEINCKLDFCESCQFEGEIDLLNDGKRYFWQCPNCGETKLSKMRIIRRVCGYLTNASVGVRQGRLADIAHRKLHL